MKESDKRPVRQSVRSAQRIQQTFYSDVWFLQHCVRVLLEDGRLKEPSPAQRKALTTLIVNV